LLSDAAQYISCLQAVDLINVSRSVLRRKPHCAGGVRKLPAVRRQSQGIFSVD
jgi:hypothetical protein